MILKTNFLTHFKSVLIGAGLLALLAHTHAVEYKSMASDKSTIGFSYKQMGVGMDGQFKKFSAQIAFDPAKPQAAKAAFDIDLTTIDTGSEPANDEVQGKGWFNTKAFPKATFIATQIKSVGAGQFEVSGTLTIKGQAREVKFPMKYAQQNSLAQFSGSLTIHRADFSIGEGSWGKFDVVANEVQINFSITAIPAK
jgi:polyisoprenoid-binding protein YceI